MAAKEVAKSILLLGKYLPTAKENAVKVAITRWELSKYLNTYFKNIKLIYAQDSKKVSKVAHIVLLEKLPEKFTILIQHKVKEVVFPLGDVTDPVTGKKVVGGMYKDDIKKTSKRFGETESVFDCDKAPPRGWQEDEKDFTRKPVYKKYYEFENYDQS